jgi:hypothetical protein
MTQTKLMGILPLLVLSIASTPTPARAQTEHNHKMPSRLVQIVREATRQYLDVNNAAPDYAPVFGCVSGPDHGAMGIHYVNGALLNGQVDAAHPQALIYEPVGNARRLVGVEYIVDAATWLSANKGVPPALYGQAFQLVGAPNRYGIPAPFFELHVWAWRDNPNGAFVDWNNLVSCEGE